MPYTRMYQTALTSCTTLSRSDGPACITRLAMRPAKSSWKKGRPWRMTCQWLCQRIMEVTLALMPCCVTRFWNSSASGRPSSSSAAMPSSAGHASSHSRSGACVESRDTSRPIMVGMAASTSATSRPATNRAANKPRAWPTKCR